MIINPSVSPKVIKSIIYLIWLRFEKKRTQRYLVCVLIWKMVLYQTTSKSDYRYQWCEDPYTRCKGGLIIEIALRCTNRNRIRNAYLNNISAWSEQIQTVGQIRIIYFSQIHYKYKYKYSTRCRQIQVIYLSKLCPRTSWQTVIENWRK